MKETEKKKVFEKTDYGKMRLSRQQLLQYLAESVLLCAVINYLFYKSAVVCILMLPIPVWYIRQRKKNQLEQRKRRLHYQFRDALSALQVGISSGYSMENAVKEARKDLERIYGKQAEMVQEFSYMENRMGHSASIEFLLYELGYRSQVEDIMNFSDILVQSKKMGGNMKVVLENCIKAMEDRIDVKKEIDALLAARKMEHRIMSVIPLGIILYLQISSPEFLSVLYGTPIGICVMTVCLGIYLTAYQWGARLVNIEV